MKDEVKVDMEAVEKKLKNKIAELARGEKEKFQRCVSEMKNPNRCKTFFQIILWLALFGTAVIATALGARHFAEDQQEPSVSVEDQEWIIKYGLARNEFNESINDIKSQIETVQDGLTGDQIQLKMYENDVESEIEDVRKELDTIEENTEVLKKGQKELKNSAGEVKSGIQTVREQLNAIKESPMKIAETEPSNEEEAMETELVKELNQEYADFLSLKENQMPVVEPEPFTEEERLELPEPVTWEIKS